MKNLLALLRSSTMGKPERLYPMILWTILESFFKGAPVGTALLIIWEVFKPLENPGNVLNINKIFLLSGILLIILIINHFIAHKAYESSYLGGYKICRDGRIEIINHLRKLPMGFYNSRDPADIGAYIVSDYANVEMLLTHLLSKFIAGLVVPILSLIIMLFFNLKLGLIAIIVIPLTYPILMISNFLIKKTGTKLQQTKIEVSSRIIEYIQGIRLIKAFNLAGTRFIRLEKSFQKLKKQSIISEAAPAPTITLSNIILNSGLIFIMLVGMSLLMKEEITITIYVMFLLVSLVIYGPLMEAFIYLAEINYMKLSVNRIEKLRLTPPLSNGNSNEINNYDIELKNVKFNYSKDVPVIRGISLKIPSNSLTAFIGPSGSGKTTLTRLIARFWDINEGEIIIGGKNIKSYNVDTFMSKISIVFQDVYLFKDTIFNNIKIGKENATDEEVVLAAKKAHCHDFIEALPNKYETMVGEGGSTLSGGEKQRISIARAILKDAPIILLDEATSSLDPMNELYIQKAINDLIKNRTVIIIAHRLNTITTADKIVVLNEGKVVEQGKHDELIKLGGLYKNLWQEQQNIKSWKF